MANPDAPPTAPWWRRPSPALRGRVAATAIATLGCGCALHTVVGSLIDWGMDNRLTPGVWEPRFLVIGYVFGPLIASPILLLLAAATAAAFLAGHRRPPRRCGACVRELDPVRGRCPGCDGAPRLPARLGDSAGLARTCATVGACLLVGALCAVLLTPIAAWVRLELEEDDFGRRADAAAAGGAFEYQATSSQGSVLTWRKGEGYSSYRD